MALSIGVQKGSKLLVGGETIEIVDIVYGHSMDVRVQGAIHHVTDQERTLIMPDVYVSYGKNLKRPGQPGARLAFEAPRSIRINRL
jgi:hypothetical protein